MNCDAAASATASIQRVVNFSNLLAYVSKHFSPPNSKTNVSSANTRNARATKVDAFTAAPMTAVPSVPERQLPVAATSEPNPFEPTARDSHSSKNSSKTGIATLFTKYNRQSALESPLALSKAFCVSSTTTWATYGALYSTSPSPALAAQFFASFHDLLARSSRVLALGVEPRLGVRLLAHQRVEDLRRLLDVRVRITRHVIVKRATLVGDVQPPRFFARRARDAHVRSNDVRNGVKQQRQVVSSRRHGDFWLVDENRAIELGAHQHRRLDRQLLRARE